VSRPRARCLWHCCTDTPLFSDNPPTTTTPRGRTDSCQLSVCTPGRTLEDLSTPMLASLQGLVTSSFRIHASPLPFPLLAGCWGPVGSLQTLMPKICKPKEQKKIRQNQSQSRLEMSTPFPPGYQSRSGFLVYLLLSSVDDIKVAEMRSMPTIRSAILTMSHTRFHFCGLSLLLPHTVQV